MAKFARKTQQFGEFSRRIGCEFFYNNDALSETAPTPRRRVFVGTVQDCISQFHEDKISLDEIDTVIVSDVDYLQAFGQVSNFWRLFGFFTSRKSGFMSSVKLALIGSEESNEETAKMKTGFDFPFTVVRVVRESRDSEQKPARPTVPDCVAGNSDLIQAIFNQYFYANSPVNCFSLLYVVLKFNLFANGTLVVADSVDKAYLVSTFLERSQVASVKLYNHKHPIAVRAYNLALFNSKQASILVTTKHFLDDYLKNRNSMSTIKGIRNVVFMNCPVDFGLYSRYLELLQGEEFSGTADSKFDLNILFVAQLSQAESRVGQDCQEVDAMQSLNDIMEEQEKLYRKVLFEPVFVDQTDVNMYAYRVDSVLQTLTPRYLKNVRAIELNKIILKSKKMKEYFNNHSNERELLLTKYSKLIRENKRNTVKLPQEIPDYLTPSFVKREGKGRPGGAGGRELSGAQKGSKEQQKKGAERPFSEVVGDTDDKANADPRKLKTFSSHKLWKIKHKKIRKREDKQMLRKGIYKS